MKPSIDSAFGKRPCFLQLKIYARFHALVNAQISPKVYARNENTDVLIAAVNLLILVYT